MTAQQTVIVQGQVVGTLSGEHPIFEEMFGGRSYNLHALEEIARESNRNFPNEESVQVLDACEKLWQANEWDRTHSETFSVMVPVESPEQYADLTGCTAEGCPETGVAALVISDSNALSWWCLDHAVLSEDDKQMPVYATYPPCGGEGCEERGVAPMVLRAPAAFSGWRCIPHAKVAVASGLWKPVNVPAVR